MADTTGKNLFFAITLIVVIVVVIGLLAMSAPTGKITVMQSGGTGLLIRECYEQAYKTNTSDYVIEGTVTSVESRWNSDNTYIYTYSNVQIKKYDKGAPLRGNVLEVVTPGGTVGDVTQHVDEQPILHKDAKVRLYIKQTDGEYTILCGIEGVEQI